MGCNVVFWSPVPGQTGTTANLIATAALLGLEGSSRILLCSSQGRRSNLEHTFMKGQRNSDLKPTLFNDVGIDALERLVKNHKLTPEMIQNYTLPILKDRLDLLPGTNKPDKAFYAGIKEVIEPIVTTAQRTYDLTLIDGGSGSRSPFHQTLLKKADVVIVGLNQNLSVLERFFHQKEGQEWIREQKLVYVLGRYDKTSTLTARNIARRFKVKTSFYAVPHNSGYLDAVNEGRIVDFFFRNRHVGRDHENSFFMQSVRTLAKAVAEQAGRSKPFSAGEGG